MLYKKSHMSYNSYRAKMYSGIKEKAKNKLIN